MRSVSAAIACVLTGSWGLTPSSGAESLFRGVQVNVDRTGQDIIGDAANEPTVAISPLDPAVIIIGWREFPTIQSDSRFAGVAYSRDGGRTWVNNGPLNPPALEDPASEQTDPVLAVDSQGVFLYWSELFRPVPKTKHLVYRSFDDGLTWEEPTQIQDPRTAGDKEWMVIDRTGGIGDGHVYGGWNNFDLGGPCFVRSIDCSVTFSEPQRIADADGFQQWMLHFAIGPDGELYAAWRHFPDNAIYVTKSTNANDPDVDPTFDALGAGGINGLDLQIDSGNNPGFIPLSPDGFHQLYLGVDHSMGARRGWVYCLWADRRNDVCDIYLARSRNGGFDWDASVRVNDDRLGNNAYQWMPAMSIAPDGRIDAVWYDTRNDPSFPIANSEVYYSWSADGGATWIRNRRISDAFDTTVGYPDQFKIGDYIQSISDRTGLSLAYAATFNGGQDVYYLRAWVMDDDGDSDVDLDDHAAFVMCLTGPDGEAPTMSCRWSDPDGSEAVDLLDFGRLQSDFTGAEY